MFFYIFTYFFIFFFLMKFLGALPQAPSAVCRNKALFLYRTDVFLLTSTIFFEKIIINAWSSATIWRTY